MVVGSLVWVAAFVLELSMTLALAFELALPLVQRRRLAQVVTKRVDMYRKD